MITIQQRKEIGKLVQELRDADELLQRAYDGRSNFTPDEALKERTQCKKSLKEYLDELTKEPE